VEYRVIETVRSKHSELREAGELLGVEAVDRTGLVVTSEGAFVRIFRVAPVNPLLMSGAEREKAAGTFQRLISQLHADERIQVLVEGRPVNLEELLDVCRREVEACAGPPPRRDTAARDPLALSRWRLYAALEESLHLHADGQAAVEVSHYVVVPFLPRQHVARAALSYWRRGKLPTAPLERTLTAHRRAVREHLGRIDALRAELEAEGMSTELLDGDQVARLLWAHFNSTKADLGRSAAPAGELLGELDAPVEREEALQAGVRLKEAIASASLDFDRDSQLAYVDRDACQTVAVATTTGRTTMGWLHSAMLTRQPFALCVYVHALERRRERQRLKLAYRRLFTINRGAESRGRVPDFDRYVQEREYEGLLNQLATGQQTGLFHVSIYEQLRARGPDPDLSALSEAVDFCTEQIESAGDCKVNAGTFRQQQLWESVLPLGRDVAAQVRKYPTVNAADMLPLIGTKCGSPTGVPFAFADPGRTVELLNLYDELHPNHTLLIAGRSGSGKTMTANVLLAHCVAAGARAFVIDRAGHYETLSRLIDGAQQIEIGAEDSPYALNPWDVPDPAKVPREKVAFLIALHQVMMGRLDGQQLGMLASGIRSVYGKAAALGASPTESMLREELRAQADDAHKADAPEIAAVLRSLADQLGEYCGEGTYAYLLDRPTTVPLDSPLVIFDTRACPESQLQLVMFQLMEYLTGTVQRHWATHRSDAVRPGAPMFLGRSLMLIDEAWHLIRRDETGEYANDLARRARHLGLALIVMSQQLSDFNTDYGKALVRNSAQQLLLAQNPQEIPFIAETVELSEREASELGRLKTIKGRHAQMLWLNGARGHGKVTLRVGPTEYWAFTSDPTEVAMRDQQIAEHDGNVWAAINALARRGTRAHRDQPNEAHDHAGQR
jgi:adenylylsulfate kinase-like enzyme